MKVWIVMLIAGISYRFVDSLDKYDGDAQSFITMLWRGAEIVAFVMLLRNMPL